MQKKMILHCWVDCVFVVDRHLLSEVEISGYLVVESLMRPFLIIEEEVVGQSPVEVCNRVVGLDVEVLVFDRAPEAFDEDVVECSTASIHADGDALLLQAASEPRGGELAALVGVKDLGLADGEGLVQSLQAEIDLQRVGDPPGQDISTKPVHHGHQIHKALWHRHVGDVGAPHLIGPVDHQPPQKVGINALLGGRPAGARTWINGFQSHFLHQPLHPLAVDLVSPSVQNRRHSA